jgi:hypothetical protein
MNTCEHEWDRVHEECIIGGTFPIGWKCRKCNKYVDTNEITPSGLPGLGTTGRHVLIAPHGTVGVTSSGQRYRRQVLEADGTLTIEAA